MGATQHNPNSVNARRFAGLFAGFDVGNGSDEEAASKGLALRRMASDAGMRIVDVLELPDVRQALDDQMQPKRNEKAVLEKAREQTNALRTELLERTRDVRMLAEKLREQEDAAQVLREELAALKGKRAVRSHVAAPSNVIRAPTLGAQSWVFECAGVVLALGLIVMALLH